jgi:hypothetical protein
VSFSILWWDVSKEFDESWGQEPALPDVTTNVGQLVSAALASPESWSAQLPAGGEAMITLGPVTRGAGLLAHPLGRLTVTQRVAPFGLKISRFGDSRITGIDQFEITKVKVGIDDADFDTAQEFFSRAQFQDLPEEQKLTNPSFERFTAGAMIGLGGFSTPAPVVLAETLRDALLNGGAAPAPRRGCSDLSWKQTCSAGKPDRSNARLLAAQPGHQPPASARSGSESAWRRWIKSGCRLMLA